METVVSRYWVGTSWKMNKTLGEALAFAQALAEFIPALDERIQPFLLPSFTAMREVKQALSRTRVRVGAQNMHWDDDGAWTGEVSPPMLRDCGLDLVELGHSERRAHFGETDLTVGLKTAAAVKHGLVPLICVGETLGEQQAGRTAEVLRIQVSSALRFLEGDALSAPVLFAYEPVWAIGEKGTPASSGYAEAQHALIKTLASDLLPAIPPVLYGGSVNPHNAADLIAQPHVDGLFVGRSAWQPEGYIDILTRASRAIERRKSIFQ